MADSWLDYCQRLSGLVCDSIYYGGVRRGRGEPILLVPGFLAGDWAMSRMALWLRQGGYRPSISGIEWNIGCPRAKVERLGLRLCRLADDAREPVILIGHSLGGVLARSLATAYPDRVRHVIVIGSPSRIEWSAVNAQCRPALRALYSMWQVLGGGAQNCGTGACACGFGQTLSVSGAGLSSIFSRADEIIDWKACLDRDAANYEVSGRHLSLLVNPEVYRLVARIIGTHVRLGRC